MTLFDRHARVVNNEQNGNRSLVYPLNQSIAERHNIMLDQAILRCVEGSIERMSAYRGKMTQSRAAVREAMEKLTLAFDPKAKWPANRTIRQDIEPPREGSRTPGITAGAVYETRHMGEMVSIFD